MGASKGITAKNRREAGAFIALPCNVITHQNFAKLSARAVKLLVDLLAQIRMKKGGPINNGDLSIAWSLMEKRNWTSKRSLYAARDELTRKGFIQLTRQGGRHRPSLYAISWWSIDECDGKLEVSPTKVAAGTWKTEQPDSLPAGKIEIPAPTGDHIGPNTLPIRTRKPR